MRWSAGFHLLWGPVCDLPALQHRPPVPLHVVDQRDEDGRAQQQLKTQQQRDELEVDVHVYIFCLSVDLSYIIILNILTLYYT